MSANAMNVDKVTNRRRYDSSGGRTVISEPVNSKTYVESVVSFVKGISQAYSNTTPIDEKEPITWARYFSYVDAYGYENLEQETSSLFLVIGYTNGVQMWCLGTSGEAQEIFSIRNGPVKTALLLPPPPPSIKVDEVQANRPLLAICQATDSKQIFASVTIISLRSGEQVKKLQFPSDVVSIQAGPAPVLVVALKDSIHVFDMLTLNCVAVISGCCCSSGCMLNPVALGARWLIYSPSVHVAGMKSLGGVVGEGAQSYVTSVLNAAKTISKGISTVGDTVNWLASKSRMTSSGEKASSMTSSDRSWSGQRPPSAGSTERDEDGVASGIVTILDIVKLLDSVVQDGNEQTVAIEIDNESDKQFVVAHFVAHVDQPLTCLRLSSSGTLLATADALGHAFHVFSIFSHPSGPTHSAIHHLYTLWRGNTPAQVQELSFSWDSRWLTASTLRGTCHIFPISPYGGTPNLRTHTSPRVVNRTSTFHKSAGLNEMNYYEPNPSPSRRPITEGLTTAPPTVINWQAHHRASPLRPFTMSPRHPPFPLPIVLQAAGQIRLGQSPSSSLPVVLPPHASFMPSSTTDATATPLSRLTDVVIATRFLYMTRNEKLGSNGVYPDSSKRLLVISSSGYLTEYVLDPRPQPEAGRVSDESNVVMAASETVCWPLQRQVTWSTTSFSLALTNPLIVADTQCRRYYDLMRFRLKEKQHEKRPSSARSVESLSDPGRDVESKEQFHLREKTNSKLRGGKRSKAKTQSTLSTPHAPSGVVIQRNGVTSDDDLRHSSAETNVHGTSEIIQTSLTETKSEEWLSQVEMITHEGPARRLWMGPQFHFKRLSPGSTCVLSPGSSALLSNQQHLVDPCCEKDRHKDGFNDRVYDEELDVRSLNIHSARSDPVPTPSKSSRYADDYGDSMTVSIEAGSGNFDRATKELKINMNGSFDDRRYTSLNNKQCEETLMERIADAMQDYNPVVETDGKFSDQRRSIVHRTRSDVSEFVTLTESFDFNHSQPASLRAPTDT